ncbi:RNA polymerase sigma factor [uncultured Pseudokineococcus sp.]|uniref:RNA polymerase sigma factor n=1 Tax=uncultured Pseudokineococcus sp. TaxID=1642928 RepID=UPI0026107EA9|nr:RNA polymerase sigma factor [uncultured Pseudokineococcus sp.]
MSPLPTREQRFELLYDELRPQLLRFARRRAGSEAAEDVVADTFLVVWRRLEEVPSGLDDARAWVYGITRHALLNQRRGLGRRRALGLRLMTEDEVAAQGGHDDIEDVLDRVDLARAWRRLSEGHQEVLGLAVIEGLDAPGAARVLDISPVAFRLRLSRARRALRLHLHHQPSAAPAATRTTARSTP